MTQKLIATNRKASHEYHFIERFEAGIVLKGTEVKSMRQGQANLNDAYGAVDKGEIFLKSAYIAPYEKGNRFNVPERRPRKLLLNKREIRKLIGGITRKGYTIVPLRMYFSDKGKAKVEIALAKGKKTYDKREDIKRRDLDRDARRELKQR
jgi:SsrA-binding protein